MPQPKKKTEFKEKKLRNASMFVKTLMPQDFIKEVVNSFNSKKINMMEKDGA